eukprot:507636_1
MASFMIHHHHHHAIQLVDCPNYFVSSAACLICFMTTSMQSHKNLFLFDEVHFVGVVERRFDSQCVCAILYIFFVCFGACADSFYIASNKKYITCCDKQMQCMLDVVKKY